ncbi:hypothetical protein [Paraburkholderia sp. BR10954]|uniref:hypothetical protein n=1 Tax=Paraburkholderia sp. BR10954 TaxID=3236995 RepID=UPI0034D19366
MWTATTRPKADYISLQFTGSRVAFKDSKPSFFLFAATPLTTLGRRKMQELSNQEIAINPLIAGSPSDKARLEVLYVRHPEIDAVINQVRGCLKEGNRLADVRAIGLTGCGKSGMRRHASVNSSTKAAAESHGPVAAKTAEKMDRHSEPTIVEYLAPYIEPDEYFGSFVERLRTVYWSRKCALTEHFRFPEGEYLGMDVGRYLPAIQQRCGVSDDARRSALALCRQWADLDQYQALQAHFDACDAQLR